MKKGFALLMLSGAVLLGAASCGGTKPNTPPDTDNPDDDNKPDEKPVTYKYAFKGVLTLDKTFNVELNCNEDGTFKLVVKENSKTIDGTYTFTDGYGFKFKFNDTTNTEVSSTYNKETKEHVVAYELKMGDDGKGVVELKLHDDKFVPVKVDTKKAIFKNSANFKGGLTYMPEGETNIMKAKVFNSVIKVEADGTCALSFDAASEIAEVKGTYKFENNTFVFKFGDKEYKTTYDLGKGAYSFIYKATYQGKEYNVPFSWNPTKTNISCYNDKKLGGIQVDFYIYGDKTALFDVSLKSAPTPLMQTMFDTKATWELDVKQHVYTITIPNKDADPTVITTTYDAETKESSFTYTINSEYGAIEFPMKGVMNDYFAPRGATSTQFGNVTCELNFLNDKEVFRDIYGAGPAATMFDAKGSYTFVDNVIKVKFGDENEFSSVWNDEEGTYTIDYSLKGTDLTLKLPLVASVY